MEVHVATPELICLPGHRAAKAVSVGLPAEPPVLSGPEDYRMKHFAPPPAQVSNIHCTFRCTERNDVYRY